MKQILNAKQLALLMLLGLTSTFVSANKDCRFAKAYTQRELNTSSQKREDFLSQIFHKEALFARDLGYDKRTGLAIGKVKLNQRTGMPLSQNGTALLDLRAETIHIGILASAVGPKSKARAIFS